VTEYLLQEGRPPDGPFGPPRLTELCPFLYPSIKENFARPNEKHRIITQAWSLAIQN
jgi:hypothetical protein